MERFLKSRYRIGEKLSENPFSITYKGYFAGTEKPVIIKIYKRGTLNSLLINRMKQKVRELSLINSPNIAKLIDGDYGWQGFYYVREYIDGESLQQIMDSQREVGAEKAMEIAGEVSRALELAHAKGIVHGEIKPSNIFIDSRGGVKVADFIIEGEIKEAMPQKALSIMDNGRYLSPEELAGETATAASDIYSLGLVLVEMLDTKATALEKGMAGGLKKVKSGAVFNRDALGKFPKYLQDIIAKALQNNTVLRFRSMSAFRASLEKKSLIEESSRPEELITIFDNTVTQYGGDDLSGEAESLEDLGRVKLRWGKEKHRNWILALVLGAAFLSGLLYVFFFVR
ncbi:MAG: serine/threonine-protein kinase [Candidatus Margulisbacteria bacterium]|nr:serine/threonine-protein kinase [Candidatus Margulisiibacteriota bacterium]